MTDQTPTTRVLRALALPRTVDAAAAADPAGLRLGVFVDCETTGADWARDVVIELALLPFTYTADGRLAEVLHEETQVHLRDPGRAPGPLASGRTGLHDADLRGRHIDVAAAGALMARADLVVAHNARFDRPFVERVVPAARAKPWVCSRLEVPWRASGAPSDALHCLLCHYGVFASRRHRALADCEAGVWLLGRHLPGTGRGVLAVLVEAARAETVRLWAVGSPIGRSTCCARGATAGCRSRARRFPRGWWTEVAPEARRARAGVARLRGLRRRPRAGGAPAGERARALSRRPRRLRPLDRLTDPRPRPGPVSTPRRESTHGHIHPRRTTDGRPGARASPCRAAEAVCRHYLPGGRKKGGTGRWATSPARGGRSMYVRLAPPGRSATGAMRPPASRATCWSCCDFSARRCPHRTGDGRGAALPRTPGGAHLHRARLRGLGARAEAAERLWRLCRPIEGTPAEAYLRTRGIVVGREPALGFHPALYYRDAEGAFSTFPALVARAVDAGGAFAGVQRTYLDPAGPAKAPVPDARKAMGRIFGAAVWLGAAAGTTLAVAEGIETALSLVTAAPSLRAAAALSAAGLGAFTVPAGVEGVLIARDDDPAGAPPRSGCMRAAARAASPPPSSRPSAAAT